MKKKLPQTPLKILFLFYHSLETLFPTLRLSSRTEKSQQLLPTKTGVINLKH